MANIIDIVFYICAKYPYEEELSKARLTKMIYLSDWKQCLKTSHQMTNIKWYFDNYGPFVDDVSNEISLHADIIERVSTTNYYGAEKTVYRIKNQNYIANLTDEEQEIINEVIEKTQSMRWNEFINFVYSTYPIATSERYCYIDLIQKAKDYQAER